MSGPIFIGAPFCARCSSEGVPLKRHGRVLLCAGCRPAPAFVRAFRAGASVHAFLARERPVGDPLATFRRPFGDKEVTVPRGEFAWGRPAADLVSKLNAPTTLAHGLARMWRGEDGE